jgi:hypothetical protein
MLLIMIIDTRVGSRKPEDGIPIAIGRQMAVGKNLDRKNDNLMTSGFGLPTLIDYLQKN